LKRIAVIASALATVGIAALAVMVAFNPLASAANADAIGNAGAEVLHGAHLMKVKDACHHNCGGGGANLFYHGGVGVGVETGADLVYLVYFGSQWGGSPNQSTCPPNDASGQCSIQQGFFSGVGGSSWNNSVTQYCEGIASGSSTCGNGSTPAANPTGVLGGIWVDNAAAAPSRPRQSNLANEAIKAAAHFGNNSAASNTHVQYVIDTASGNNISGFGTQFCAWHSSTSSTAGDIAYTNMPYITDAGASCGSGFVNSPGTTDGITIVGGHEFAETESDIFPNGGWLDSGGAENGDKCAWISSGQGAAADISLHTGSFPVQSLWSNAFNGGAGGCVLAYP
jgi:serine protease